ncbi:ABC transporter permease [Cellvibrio sp. pealriver]|uniref:ABC transporter permease n=1 Tax=Cellvibrio sp. pealriver TaxID=1622269 RepID=UPI00066FCACD|nr:ABC transporter permease [Cellvibrio sp. pealriver]
MFDWDKWQEIITSLRKQKLRTGLTAFGVFWGIFMLVILLGFGTGFGTKIENIFGDAKSVILLWPSNSTQLEYEGLGKGRTIKFTPEDVVAIRQSISSVQMIDGKNNLGSWGAAQYIVYGKESGSFAVMGTHQGWESFEFIKLHEGRYINSLDEKEKRKVAVIGTRVQEVLFKNGKNPIGESIDIGGVKFKVIGISSSREPGDGGQQNNGRIFIPNETLRQAFNQMDAYQFLFFTPVPGADPFAVERDVKTFLYERKKIHPDDSGVIGGFNMEQNYQQNRSLINGILGFSWMVAIGTIIAGVIGVGNIMLVVVKERTREIGLRKAMGATPINISVMIIHESLIITLIAGYAGLTAGVLLLEVIKALLVKMGQGDGIFASPYIDIDIALMALVVLVITGVLAALLPAIKAASVNPITALQDE